jgi:UDP-glucose 4-epimerase
MNIHLVTGGAGFIGANLVRRLLAQGDAVVAADDLSFGRRENLKEFSGSDRFAFHQVDCAAQGPFADLIRNLMQKGPITDVWHLAANSDIPAGVADPRIDHDRTFLTTFTTLLCMAEFDIPRLHFASSSAIYGEVRDRAIEEDHGPLLPISNYGAMKLASEAQIRAAVESGLSRANIFRFPNVVGLPATHGVILDLVRKAKATPQGFDVLGNGTQKKVYLHVDALVDAMLFIAARANGRYNVFNIGPEDDGVTVAKIAEAVRDRVSPAAQIRYGAGDKGWTGDIPRFRLSVARLTALGWRPASGSDDAIRRAVDEIARQENA